MNKYEELYSIKQKIDHEVEKNRLFKLSIEDAVTNVIEKLGVLNSLLYTKNDYEQKEVLNQICNINLLSIDTITFIQESAKWIFRWCSIFCKKESIISTKEVVANDIYNLMGVAYLYEKFHDMWEMNAKRKVTYDKFDNILKFSYVNEDTYKIHLYYDNICRTIDETKLIENMNKYAIHNSNLTETLSYANQLDYNCTFDMEFEGFNLYDFRSFSNEVTKLFASKILKYNKFGVTTILPGDSGIICMDKEDWIQKLSEKSNINKDKTESMIDFFTYNFGDKSSDVSLSYFVPILNNKLIVSEAIFNFSRPEANAMRLLAKRKSTNYDYAQNNFEGEERKKIINGINNKYLISYGKDDSTKNIPGMDLLVYDPIENNLQVIELKYKIPVDSTRDINNLDNMLNKAYKQIREAKNYIDNKIEFILSEYFGYEYDMVIPNKIDYFVLTNYSIGTGINKKLPTQILLINHYIELMSNNNGMELVRRVLESDNKMMNLEEKKVYDRFSLCGYDINIPQYTFRLIK